MGGWGGVGWDGWEDRQIGRPCVWWWWCFHVHIRLLLCVSLCILLTTSDLLLCVLLCILLTTYCLLLCVSRYILLTTYYLLLCVLLCIGHMFTSLIKESTGIPMRVMILARRGWVKIWSAPRTDLRSVSDTARASPSEYIVSGEHKEVIHRQCFGKQVSSVDSEV